MLQDGVYVQGALPAGFGYDADEVDLYLMSLCRHHVLANSTFSFWAAHLSAPCGITVNPSRWFADPTWQVPDIFPEHWLGLDTPLSTLAAP